MRAFSLEGARAAWKAEVLFRLPGDEPRTPRRYAPFSTTPASLPKEC
jgi:hypothetical protein